MTQRQKLIGEVSWSVEMYLRAHLRYLGNGSAASWVNRANPLGDVRLLPSFQAACAMVALRDCLEDGMKLDLARSVMSEMDTAFHQYEEDSFALSFEKRASVFREKIEEQVRRFIKSSPGDRRHS